MAKKKKYNFQRKRGIEMTYIKSGYEELKEKYKVYNLVNKYKKVVFILESPHVDELKNNAPVAGLSGKAMTKTLFKDEATAIGIKLKGEPENKVGIMNICNIPMQRAAYVEEEIVKKYGTINLEKQSDFFASIEKIRTATKAKYKNENQNELQKYIMQDFREEMEKLKDRELLIIPCGKTAEKFFEIANVSSDKWEVLNGVPHPSFGNWSKKKYEEKIKEMKEKIKEK